MLVSGRNNVKEILNNFENKKDIKRAIVSSSFNEQNILKLINKYKISIEFKEKIELDKLVHNNHQGVILEVKDFEYTDLDELIENSNKLVILDHLEDPHNLGAIIRTVEASGIDGIILPINRSVSVNETVMKTSVGALYNVKIARVINLNQTIKKLKNKGFFIIGTDMDGDDYRTLNFPLKSVLVIGSEGFGISRLVKESCDFIAKIPMNGKINSLNASVAAGIMIYEMIRK